MTAEIIDIQSLLHPSWCDRQHDIETGGTDVWTTHSATVEARIEGTDDQCVVVWIDAMDNDKPGFTLGSDRPDCHGEIARYDGLPDGSLTEAETAALYEALTCATALVGGRIAEVAR